MVNNGRYYTDRLHVVAIGQCLPKLKKSADTYRVVNNGKYIDRLHVVAIVPRFDTFIISSPNSFLNHPVGILMLVLSLPIFDQRPQKSLNE